MDWPLGWEDKGIWGLLRPGTYPAHGRLTSDDHEVGFTTCPNATRPIPTAVNEGCSNPPHATSRAPAPQSLGCRTLRCSHWPGIRPRSRPCRPRTTHASQSAPTRISSGSRSPANDVDMVAPPVGRLPRSLRGSVACPCGHRRLDFFAPKQPGWGWCLELVDLSPGLAVRRRPQTSAGVRRRCPVVGRSPLTAHRSPLTAHRSPLNDQSPTRPLSVPAFRVSSARSASGGSSSVRNGLHPRPVWGRTGESSGT
jgi:hypothetical protein